MQPPILQMQQHTMAAQAFLRARNRFFFSSCFLHFGGTFLPLCWGCMCVCVQAFIPNPPLPQSRIDPSLLRQSWYPAHIQPSQLSPSLSLTHIHTHCALASPPSAQLSPTTPSPALPTGQGASPPAPHSPIWILLGKLAPNTAPRKLVQKKAKMCCIFPFALAKKKPSSKHRFDFSPALLSLAASLRCAGMRVSPARNPALTLPEQRLAAGLTEPRQEEREPAPHPHPSPATHNTHTHTHTPGASTRLLPLLRLGEHLGAASPDPALPRTPGVLRATPPAPPLLLAGAQRNL